MKKPLIVFVVTAAGVACLLLILKFGSDTPPGDGAQHHQANGRDHPGASAQRKDSSFDAASLASWLAINEGREERLRHYMQHGMPEEDKRAMPKDASVEWWAFRSAYQMHEARQNGEVEFYGKLVDENQQPLKGVHLHGRLYSVQPTLAAVAASKNKTCLTSVGLKIAPDENGRFEVKNKKGTSLVLEYVTPEGYEFAPSTENGFTFVPDGVPSTEAGPRHKPDPNSPVVLVMRKTPRE